MELRLRQLIKINAVICVCFGDIWKTTDLCHQRDDTAFSMNFRSDALPFAYFAGVKYKFVFARGLMKKIRYLNEVGCARF